MTTILFGWELGANLGHAMPLAAMARALSDNNLKVVVASRDLFAARTAFNGMDVSVFQAPVWPDHSHDGIDAGTGNYLDILVQIGFADFKKCVAMTSAWLALLDVIHPDLIVADHSPALLLAAHIRGASVILSGTCFTMPPADYPVLPPIRADRAPIVPEAQVSGIMREVAHALGGAAPPSLPELFRTRARLVFGSPLLDPYAAARREPLLTPPEGLPDYLDPPSKPRLFVYLGPEIPHIDKIVQILAGLDIHLSVYLRGELTALGRFLALRGHQVFDTPPRLSDVLPNASHVLSGAGATTCHGALAAGRPMLAIPLHGEAELNVIALERLGTSRRLDPYQSERAMRETIIGFLRDHTLLRQARHWAKSLALAPLPSGLDAFKQAVARVLAATP